MKTDTLGAAIDTRLVHQHVGRAVGLFEQHGADALFVFSESNILAFCGVPLAPSDRLVCGLINRDGRIAFVVPDFEAEIACTLPPTASLFTWQESDDPFAVVADAAAALGVEHGRILLDRFTWLGASMSLSRSLPHASLVLDPGITETVRLVKSAEEVAAIRCACNDVGVLYEFLPRMLRAGMSEVEAHTAAIVQLEQRGIQPLGLMLQSGESASVPHQEAGARVLALGDMIVADFVAVRGGYHGDMTRTYAVGRPKDEMLRAYAAVRGAQCAAIEAIRPGVACEAIDTAARSYLDRLGLGGFFSHRLGHGIGLDCHEPPYLVQGNKQRLQPGMCVTIEPGVYVRGRFGVRIEDVVVVTDDGCRVLSDGVPTDVSDVFV